MAKKTDIPSDEKAQLLLETVEDRLAIDPVLLDLRGKTLMTDFFLVCSGNSDVHIRAISDAVLERSGEERLSKPRIEGQGAGEWVLLDFGDVVLHVMSEEQRERYKLEEFWSRPHPDGEMPPTPRTALGTGDDEAEDDEADLDARALEDEDLDDAAFFEDADTEVEPIDEDEVENEDGQFDDFDGSPPGRQSRKSSRNGTGGGGSSSGGAS